MRLEDQIVALTVLQDRVKKELDARRKEWVEQARPKARDTAMIGDEVVGSVSWRAGAQRFQITDMAALVAWAQEHAPHLVSYDPTIPENHLAVLRKNPVDEHGELLPGFDVAVGDPGATVRTEKAAADVIARAVADGHLTYADMLELEQ